jgi:hypothetical protein
VLPVTPVAPVAPVLPVHPVGPVLPVTPVAPVGPVLPVRPVGPLGPVLPVTPVAPVFPVGPAVACTNKIDVGSGDSWHFASYFIFKNSFIVAGMRRLDAYIGAEGPPLENEYFTLPFISASIVNVAPTLNDVTPNEIACALFSVICILEG